MDAKRLAQFGHRLRRARQALGLSGAALAKRAHVSRKTIASLEAASQHPEPKTLTRLASALGVPEHALVGVPPIAVTDPLLEHLTDEDLHIAQAFHHAPTEARQRVLRVLSEPTTKDRGVVLNEIGERLAHLDPGQQATVISVIEQFERLPPPPRE